jgi:hypothetical protein
MTPVSAIIHDLLQKEDGQLLAALPAKELTADQRRTVADRLLPRIPEGDLPEKDRRFVARQKRDGGYLYPRELERLRKIAGRA